MELLLLLRCLRDPFPAHAWICIQWKTQPFNIVPFWQTEYVQSISPYMVTYNNIGTKLLKAVFYCDCLCHHGWLQQPLDYDSLGVEPMFYLSLCSYYSIRWRSHFIFHSPFLETFEEALARQFNIYWIKLKEIKQAKYLYEVSPHMAHKQPSSHSECNILTMKR